MAVIREFLSALRARESYTTQRSRDLLFGLLWGAPVALIALGLHMAWQGPPCGLGAATWLPLLLAALLHPPLFAVFFAALGTLRARREVQLRALVEKLDGEVARLEWVAAENRESERRKDDFLGNVTHDLKTPLVTIRGYADMMRSGRLGELNPRQERAVQVMRKSARRLQEQIDRLLAFNSNRSYLGELRWEQVALLRLLEEVEEHHSGVAENKGVTLTIRRPGAPHVLWGDRERLLEVLDNLLSNAIKFTGEGGRVLLRFGEPEAGTLPAEVEDDGCGIPSEAHETIFERFRQAHPSVREQFGGSGLGLAIVRSNLDAHGCSIRVESEEGKGSRFLFSLPLAHEESHD